MLRSTLYRVVFGLLGGLVAWGVGEFPQRWSRTPVDDFALYQASAEQISKALRAGDLTITEAVEARNNLNRAHAGNPYVRIINSIDASQRQKAYGLARLRSHDQFRSGMGAWAWFSVVGLVLAIFVSSADPVAIRNARQTAMAAAVGAACGLVGGFMVCMLPGDLRRAIPDLHADAPNLATQVLMRSAAWAVLGLFVAAGAGITLRSWRRFAISLAAGIAGGLVAGALFDPVSIATGSGAIGRLLGLVAIGVVTGLGISQIEKMSRRAWLRIVDGPLRGRQFILYRKVICIGRSRRCELYLPHEPQIGRLHAAIRRVAGGYEIEDLHTGGGTLVNAAPIDGAALSDGDRIQIGSTCLLFRRRPGP
jgi:hypothetical protein